MNVQLLIDSIVRQTTVLIAQLATSGGVRAPLAHIASSVFLELAEELSNQGLSRKVSADMFGLGLRTYLRKIQRLSESSTERGRSLWEAILDYLSRGEPVSRADLLQRFYRDDEVQVRGVLKDLMESGLVFGSGAAQNQVFRAATPEELGGMQALDGEGGLEELIWALIYREGPLTRGHLLKRGAVSAAQLDSVLATLIEQGRVSRERTADGDATYDAVELLVPLGAVVGWEAAVFDHFQAMVKTVTSRLSSRSDPAARETVGGSTYTFDISKNHPLAPEVLGLLKEFRTRAGELRARVEAHNSAEKLPKEFQRVIAYVGQSVLDHES